MAEYHRLVAFDRPLAGAAIFGSAARLYTEGDLAAAREAAYREGAESTRAFADRQVVELRNEVHVLQDGILGGLRDIEGALVAQLRTSLPELLMEIARRMLAGFAPPAEVVEKLCADTLEQLYPERENLELIVSPRDAALLEKLTANLATRYPGLRISADPLLHAGDCQVRSRFGLTDARMSAKLDALQHEIVSPA